MTRNHLLTCELHIIVLIFAAIFYADFKVVLCYRSQCCHTVWNWSSSRIILLKCQNCLIVDRWSIDLLKGKSVDEITLEGTWFLCWNSCIIKTDINICSYVFLYTWTSCMKRNKKFPFSERVVNEQSYDSTLLG